MSIPAQEPVLSPAPQEYQQAIFASWQLQLAMFFKRLNNRGPVHASTLVLSDLPSSSAGLPSGSVWYDPGDSNRLKYVP